MPIRPFDRRLRVLIVVIVAAIAGCSGSETRKVRYLTRGKAFLAAGNYEKARLEFRNALQIAPNDSEARFENGQVAEKLGNGREAAQFYQGAIDRNPDHVEARAALGRLYILAGSPNQALDTIKPSLDKHPDDAGLLTVRAASRQVLKDLPDALVDAERAVKLAPTDENAVSVLAGIYESEGQSDKALALLQDKIRQLPGTVTLRLELAQIYMRHQQDAQAEALLVELVHLKPAERSHRLRLAQFYMRVGRTDDAERVLREGIAALPGDRVMKASLIEFLMARRSREAAEKELRGFIASEPKDYALRLDLGQFYEQGKDFAAAEAVYKGVIAETGTTATGITARDRLADLRAQQNDIPGAEKLLTEVLAEAPRDNDALFLRANLALRQRDPKTAIADLRSVLRDLPNAVAVMRVLARAHLANGEPALAEETMRRALDASPNDAAVRLDLAKLLIELNKPEQAKPVIAALVAQQPNNLEALSAQFQIAAVGNDLPAAKVAADAIVATNPKVDTGYYYQGLIAEKEKRADDAIRLYSTALERQPASTPALESLTRVLVAAKRIPEALKRLDDVAAQFPGSIVPYNIKGETLMSLGRQDEAEAAFRAAIGRQPKDWAGYRNLAVAQVTHQDSKAAMATLEDGIGKVASPENLEMNLATLYEKSGDVDAAIRLYDSALRRNPGSDAIANNLAMLLVDTKHDAASLERAKTLAARFSTSTNPQLLDTYGWVLYRRGEATGALTALQAASAKSPNAPVLWYHLGMAQLLSGHTAAARDCLSRSLQAGQNFPGVDEAKATLEKLGNRG